MADALIIIDMQNGVCHGDQPLARLPQVIVGIQQRLTRYRLDKKPVIFVQHNDEDLVQGQKAWQIIPEFSVDVQDIKIQKTHANSFYQTDLRQQLQQRGIQSLEICGAQVEFCVDATIKMAHGLGYQLEMVRGLTTTTDNSFMTAEKTLDFYQERIWNHRFLEFIEE